MSNPPDTLCSRCPVCSPYRHHHKNSERSSSASTHCPAIYFLWHLKLSGITSLITSHNMPDFSFAHTVPSAWNVPLLFTWFYPRAQFKPHSLQKVLPDSVTWPDSFVTHSVQLSFSALSSYPTKDTSGPCGPKLRLMLGVARWIKNDLRT